MAYINYNTTQEALNIAAGFTGPLRTQQECLNKLANKTGLTSQDAANFYAGTTKKTKQEALNAKAGTTGKIIQDTILKINGINR